MTETGILVSELPLHRDPHFQNWSAERRSTMPTEMARALRRARWIHSHERTSQSLAAKAEQHLTRKADPKT